MSSQDTHITDKLISDKVKTYLDKFPSDLGSENIDFESLHQDLSKGLNNQELSLLFLYIASLTFEIVENKEIVRNNYIQRALDLDPSITEKPLFNLLGKLIQLDLKTRSDLNDNGVQDLKKGKEVAIKNTASVYCQFVKQYKREPFWIEGVILSYIAILRGKNKDYMEIYLLMKDGNIEKPYIKLWRTLYSSSLFTEMAEDYKEECKIIDKLLDEGKENEALVLAIQIAENLPAKHKLKGLEKILEKVSPVNKSPRNKVESSYFSMWHHIMAQILVIKGKTENVANHFELAKKYYLEGVSTEEDNGLCYIHLSYGHYLYITDQQEAALAELKKSWECASDEDVNFIAYEYGSILLETDKPIEAIEILKTIRENYENINSAKVILAECYYTLGNFEESRKLLNPLIEEGNELIASNIILGHIELDYYDLKQALQHFSKVVEHSIKGTVEWILGHQMMAEILAQQGFKQPHQILMHANLALTFLDENDERHNTLTQHKEKALSMINTQLN